MSDHTAPRLLAEVRKLATERPKAVYQSPERALAPRKCYYNQGTAGGAVGCIIGQALTQMGVPAERLNGVISINRLYRRLIEEGHELEHLTEWQMTWLHEVQTGQDSILPWGEAIRRADERSPYWEHGG